MNAIDLGLLILVKTYHLYQWKDIETYVVSSVEWSCYYIGLYGAVIRSGHDTLVSDLSEVSS